MEINDFSFALNDLISYVANNEDFYKTWEEMHLRVEEALREIVREELNARYTNCTCQHRTMDIDDLGNEGFFS